MAKYEEKYGKIPKKSKKKRRKKKSSAEASDDSDRSESEDDDKPDPPKRPATGFFRFIKAIEPEMREEFPDLKRTQIVSKIGEKWKSLQQEEKDEYNIPYQEEKKAFDLEKAAYEKKWGKIKRKKKRSRKKKSKSPTSSDE